LAEGENSAGPGKTILKGGKGHHLEKSLSAKERGDCLPHGEGKRGGDYLGEKAPGGRGNAIEKKGESLRRERPLLGKGGKKRYRPSKKEEKSIDQSARSYRRRLNSRKKDSSPTGEQKQLRPGVV